MLISSGFFDTADRILIEKTKRSISHSDPAMAAVLHAIGSTIGYGYKLERALLLFFFLVLVGWFVYVDSCFKITNCSYPFREAIWYSIDRAVPSLSLNRSYEQTEVLPFAYKVYF